MDRVDKETVALLDYPRLLLVHMLTTNFLQAGTSQSQDIRTIIVKLTDLSISYLLYDINKPQKEVKHELPEYFISKKKALHV